MTLLLLILTVFVIVLWRVRRARARRKADQLYPFNLILTYPQLSVYSKELVGGRVFYVLDNSAPVFCSSAIYHSSNLDNILDFISKIDVSRGQL